MPHDARAADLAPTVAEIQAGGARSLRAIAAALNERSIRTPRGVGDRFFATSEHSEPLIVVMGAGRPKCALAPYRSADALVPSGGWGPVGPS